MANWNLPGLADNYANFLAYLKDRDVDAVTMFKSGTPSNLPTGALRLNRTSFRMEEWNGTAWDVPFGAWAINISGNAATATSAIIAAACSGNAATATVASAVAWTGVTGKPTTLGGYGITDAVPSARTVSAGTGLSGGGALSSNVTLSLTNTGVTAGSYGSAAEITSFTVDGQGRITAAGKTALTTAVASLAASAGGTANALTVGYTPAITALGNGMVLVVRAGSANTSTSVTIAVNAVAAVGIVKGSGDPLAIGDIAGAGHWLILVFDSAQGKFLLINPATSVVQRAGAVNRIINGGFTINQRAFAGGGLTAGAYGHDRWKAGVSGCTYTLSGGAASITAGTLQQVIEGANVPEGGTYTLSWTGTAQARVDGGSYSASPLVVTGKTAGANTTVEFGTGTVDNVQYEPGSNATGYEQRHIGDELMLCQRYRAVVRASLAGTSSAGGQIAGSAIALPVTMRAAPTLSLSGNVQMSNILGSVLYENSAPTGFRFTAAGAAAGGFIAVQDVIADSEL